MKNQNKQFINFLKKSCGFLPLLIALIIAPLFFLFIAGEFKSFSELSKLQNQKEKTILLGQKYYSETLHYKLISTQLRKPQVLSLGSSRVMAFRSKFFNKNINFYNAGGGARHIPHYRQFLERLNDDQLPKIIIAAFDQHFFNPNWSGHQRMAKLKYDNPRTFTKSWNWSRIYFIKDLYSNNSFKLSKILNYKDSVDETKIGLNAILFDSGYLNDGSWFYGKIAKTKKSEYHDGFSLTIKRLTYGLEDWEYADSIHQKSILELEKFIRLCKKKNIHLISFLPPFPNKVYKSFQKMGNKQSYIFKIAHTIEPIFKKYSLPFFDFSDLASLGSNDEESFDGHHGSEKAYARLLLELSKNDTILKKVVNNDFTKARILQSEDPLFIVGKNEF